LVLLATVHLLSHLVDKLERGREVGRAVERNAIDRLLISLNDALQAIDFRIEDVTV